MAAGASFIRLGLLSISELQGIRGFSLEKAGVRGRCKEHSGGVNQSGILCVIATPGEL